MNHPHAMKARSQGATLVIALIFLIIIAMLGVTTADVSVMEERMAGASRDRELALQAAEAALRDAEVRLATDVFRANFPVPNYVATNANSAAYWENCFTNAALPCGVKYTPALSLPSTGTGAIASPPEFIVERKQDEGAGPVTNVYRVTARAVGGTIDAVVVLQAEFTYTQPAP